MLNVHDVWGQAHDFCRCQILKCCWMSWSVHPARLFGFWIRGESLNILDHWIWDQDGYGIMMPLSYITWRTRQNFLVDPMIRDRSWISHGMEDSQQMSTIHTWIIHQHTVYFRIPYTDTQDTTISTCILCIYHMSRLSIPWLENPLLATVDGDPKSTFQAFGSKASDWLAFS